MRIYTSLNAQGVTDSLLDAKAAALIHENVYLLQFDEHPYTKPTRTPRVNDHRFTIRLGTRDQTGILDGSCDSRGRQQRKRHSWNVGYDSYYTHRETYAATWDEWGWFLAYLFSRDRDAICGWYRGKVDFWHKTDQRYLVVTATVGDDTTRMPMIYGDDLDLTGNVAAIRTYVTSAPYVPTLPECTCIMGNTSGITTSIMDCKHHTEAARRVIEQEESDNG